MSRHVQRACQLVLGAAFAAGALVALPTQAALTIPNTPLFLVKGKANVLITLDNSNSMDEAPNGSAVGSNNAASKSEIARGVVRNLTDNYRNRVNMGLMAYRQNSPSSYQLHNSPYDVSYNPADYNAAWTGSRSAQTKKYRIPNPTSAGNYVHFNVGLPFYAGSNQGNAFCYSSTANASNNFNNGETLAGPWDSYRCFNTKTGTSNTLPTSGATETSNGYSGNFYNGQLSPTDSDFAQGILDFGRFLTWHHVGPTWFNNASPGRGYLHIPLGDLDSAKAVAIKAKLACNVPGDPTPCTSAGIKNAGLTPIEGTLLTARDYYKGTWTAANEGYTAACYPLPTSCGKNFVVLLTDGLPSTDKNGNALSNPTTALADAAAAAAALKADGVETYVIGFALPYGTNPASLNQIATAGGTGTAYDASDSASLQAAFDAIFEDIIKKTSSFGSVAQNSTALDTGSMIFQGRFDSTDWSGELQALRPSASGTVTKVWSTDDPGRIALPAVRKVFTLVPGVGGKSLDVVADLGSAQQTALATPNCSASLTGAACAKARIDWLRGDRTLEDPVGPLRKRHKVMGDIIGSSPVYVRENNTVFVGANDGMLHAFDATTGNEQFAYLPAALVAAVPALTSATYSHQYMVDGDIAVTTRAQGGGKNILVGALGRGGRSLYALDVTTPGSFGAAHVLWEFTHADLGLVLGPPVIAKLNNGKTAVIVGNGPNSTNERSVIWILDIADGSVLKKIETSTGTGTNNGMGAPVGWDKDNNGTIDLLYAGDLLGNLWKFDLTSASTASWGSAFTSGSNPAPFFKATDSTGTTAQSITGIPSIGINYRRGDPNFGKRYVFFGTGRYVTTSDVTNTATQSWYGLIDDDTTAIPTRCTATCNDLRLRTIDAEGFIGTKSVRTFSSATAGDMTGKRGWVVDMLSPAGTAQGERFIGEQKHFGHVLLATTIVPSSNTCQPGGTGYINAIDPYSGANPTDVYFDINGDGKFDGSDKLGGKAAGSEKPNVGLPTDGLIIRDLKFLGGTDGNIEGGKVQQRQRIGRISWREIVTQ